MWVFFLNFFLLLFFKKLLGLLSQKRFWGDLFVCLFPFSDALRRVFICWS